uniref:BTB domain-containing protein n=1 Tax=Panagrolaimus davidi TaxID=227884 RepID=A0A914Q8E0_9BILA
MKGLLIFKGVVIPKVLLNAGVLGQGLWERDDKDFKIVVKNEGSIKIHKLVLATQSDSFNGMLQSGMQEAITNTLQITDFNLKTVGFAVEFFYERNIFETLTFDDAFELLRFADKYRIPYLQDRLEFYLSIHLSPATVCKFTNGSIYANSTNLQRECSDFLMLCSRFTIAVDDLEELNNEFAAQMFKKSFSSH